MTIAAGRNIHHQGHVEAGAAIHHCFGVFRHLFVQHGGGFIISGDNGVFRTDGKTAGTANALFSVNGGFSICTELGGAVSTDPGAGMASNAEILLDIGLSRVVLLHFSRPGTTAHTDVFHGATHARLLVTLKVGEGDKYVGIHDGPADFGLFYILAACHGDLHIVAALQSVADENMAAGGIRGKSVDISRLYVVQGIFAPADIQGVAIGQKGLAAL